MRSTSSRSPATGPYGGAGAEARASVAVVAELAGALGRQDAGQAGDLEDVALGQGAVADQLGGGGGHADQAAGAGLAEGLRLGAGVDHAAGAVLVEVGEFTHGKQEQEITDRP